MESLRQCTAEGAPPHWAASCIAAENRLHQLAPYIGKLKSSIAASLIEEYTVPGETVLDPFCGSGTVPLECALRGRNVLASDSNAYAVLLTRAKLEAPRTLDYALSVLNQRLEEAQRRRPYDLRRVPLWVRRFFHPATLQDALKFADECLDKADAFNLACLLGILHHQRPGFLSYPSSHLVPYLRERNFPRAEYPELYGPRALAPRLQAKVTRALRNTDPTAARGTAIVEQRRIGELAIGRSVDAVVTSPPYMNALDYIRDNRLRMWFIDRTVTDYSPEPTDKRSEFSALTAAFVQNALEKLRVGGICVLIVGESVHRKKVLSHPAEHILAQLSQLAPDMLLQRVVKDVIPDVRRGRRDGAATKTELVLVLQKAKRFSRSVAVPVRARARRSSAVGMTASAVQLSLAADGGLVAPFGRPSARRS